MEMLNQVPLAIPVEKREAKNGIKYLFKKVLKPDKRKIKLAVILICIFVFPYVLSHFKVLSEKSYLIILIVPLWVILIIAYDISLIFDPLYPNYISRTGMGYITLFIAAILTVIISYLISCWIIWFYDRYKKKRKL